MTCGHCYFCKVKMEPSLCTNRWVYGIHTTCAEPPYLTGNYAEYLPMDQRVDFFKMEPDTDLQTLVPASCSGATTAHAFDLSRMESGDSVLVQGVGPLGIFAVAFAQSFGASQIVAIGGTEERLRMSQSFGATLAMNRNKLSKKERKEAVMDITHGLGVDVAFEMAGELDAMTECISLDPDGRSVHLRRICRAPWEDGRSIPFTTSGEKISGSRAYGSVRSGIPIWLFN